MVYVMVDCNYNVQEKLKLSLLYSWNVPVLFINLYPYTHLYIHWENKCIIILHATRRMCWLGAHTHFGLLASINCAGSHISGKWWNVYIHINLLKPSGFCMYHQVEHSKILHGARFELSILYRSKNRQWLLLYTSLTDWFL
jgi:hypothetical protein